MKTHNYRVLSFMLAAIIALVSLAMIFGSSVFLNITDLFFLYAILVLSVAVALGSYRSG